MRRSLADALNAIALCAVAFVLLAAFAGQVWLGELPCPLCMLQRVLFGLLAVGPMLNLRFGPRPSHYGLSLLAAVAGAVVSGRQILLHILPGDAGYGSPLFGRHFYTWAFVAFAGAIVAVAAVLQFDGQFEGSGAPRQKPGVFAASAAWLVIGLTALNVASALLECGFGPCDDNPLVYRLLQPR